MARTSRFSPEVRERAVRFTLGSCEFQDLDVYGEKRIAWRPVAGSATR